MALITFSLNRVFPYRSSGLLEAWNADTFGQLVADSSYTKDQAIIFESSFTPREIVVNLQDSVVQEALEEYSLMEPNASEPPEYPEEIIVRTNDSARKFNLNSGIVAVRIDVSSLDDDDFGMLSELAEDQLDVDQAHDKRRPIWFEVLKGPRMRILSWQ